MLSAQSPNIDRLARCDTIAVLAGGLATRMQPLTLTRPKALLEVAGAPFVHHQLRLFARNGIRRAVLLVGHMGELIETAVGDGARFGLTVDYVRDGDVLRGTGGALRHALPQLPERFFVTYGDSHLDVDYAAVAAAFDFSRFAGLMTLYRNDGRYDRSNADFNDGRALYRKVGAPPAWRHIDFGLLVMTAGSLASPDDRPFDLAELLADLSAKGRLQGHEVHRRFYEIGSPSGLAETAAHLAGTELADG
jgi:NDP-sugar pyrophosphorylase family protein